MRVFCMKRRGGKSFRSAFILCLSEEKCQITQMAFKLKKKKLKRNLSKTLQVLRTVAIVSQINDIQLMLQLI